MDSFTVRYAHLEKLPDLQKGDLVTYGDKICRMGSTGQSKFNHLHIDCVHGSVDKIIRLFEIDDDKNISNKKYKSNENQLNYFIDKDLFMVSSHVTSKYMDPKYKERFGKDHPAIDVVPIDRHKTTEHFDIFWNRTKTGHVLNLGLDVKGYGYYILIGFEV